MPKEKRVYNKSTGRDYKKEAKYQATPIQKKRRALRNKARREMIRRGLVKKGDGKDVDHKRPLANGGTSATSNLRVLHRSVNRGKKPKGYDNTGRQRKD